MYVASTSNNSVEVRRLTQLSGDETLRAGWNALARGVPFRRWEWLESWWRAYGAAAGRRRELLLLGIWSAGRLVGGAPWYREESAAQGHVIRFLGDGEACSDYLGLVCQSGCETIVARALAGALAATADAAADSACGLAGPWDLLELDSVSAAEGTLHLLLEQLTAQGCLVHGSPGPTCWRVDLPPTWPEYLGLLSRSHRKQLLRIERRYLHSGRARLHTARTDDEVHAGLQILAELHQRRWEVLGQPGCFARPQFAEFLFDVAHHQLRAGQLQLHWLECDGRPIAAEYHIVDGNAVLAYQSGIEPRALEHEPGRIITLLLLQQAIAAGRTAFDFLRGDEPYKAHWRAEPRPTTAYRVLPDHGRSRLRHSLWLAGGSVKRWLKSGLRWSAADQRQDAGRDVIPLNRTVCQPTAPGRPRTDP